MVKATKVTKTQKEAIEIAGEIAKTEKATVNDLVE